MLDPENRYTYLAELKPPAGYVLDRALGTTFSLDLQMLLMAPLAMVFYECQKRDSELGSRVEVIEALQRVADRLIIFCQKGRIAVPRVDTLLYSYLEPVVVEAQQEGDGAFHPKIWLLRFAAEGHPVIYRFLCLSRNLTSDCSWDTVLSLEGELQERKVGYSINRPLRDFVRALPGLAVRGLGRGQRRQVEFMAEEAGRVIFEVPPEFDPEYRFVPSGIKGYRYPRIFGKGCSRLAVVSPFISPEQLMQWPTGGAGDDILITREESLDSLSEEQCHKLSAKYRLYTIHDVARPVDEEKEVDGMEIPVDEGDPTGLHAKLYAVEDGAGVQLATGSANATAAAFGGRNVEFMVMLSGRKGQCGIDRLFGDDPDSSFPGKLFRPYERLDEISEKAVIQKELTDILEAGRRSLLQLELALQVLPEEDNLYSLVLEGSAWPDAGSALKGSCYPITLKKDHALGLNDPSQVELVFARLPAVCLTSFVVFRLEARHRGREGALAFVLNLPVKGMPEERGQEILHSLIASREQFIRYLLFLLSEADDIPSLRDDFESGSGQGAKAQLQGFSLPLLEELVRAYSRHPEKIERIARLVNELGRSKKGEEILPEGFRELWAVIEKAGGVASNE